MQWLVTNWFWVVMGVAFVGMHLGGHGGHGGHGGGNRQQRIEGGNPQESPGRKTTESTGSHRH